MRYLNIYRAAYSGNGFDLAAMEHQTQEEALKAATPKFDDYVLVAVAVPAALYEDYATFPPEVFA